MRVYLSFWQDAPLGVDSDPDRARARLTQCADYYREHPYPGYDPTYEYGVIGVADVDGDYLGLLDESEEGPPS